ncbi:MAG: SRPBCC domain-containing protein [Patescibacteria group bacterium]|nr:SRPBCC domain-containing protein [Patescibacteria group bacterium]
MKTIIQDYRINASIEKVWEALVNPRNINNWGGGPAKMDDKEGTKFSLWGGDIHGTNIEVERFKKLVQEWYGGKWEEPSIVTFKLQKLGNSTKLSLLHENVPDNEYDDIDKGWKEYYLGPLKEYAEGK